MIMGQIEVGWPDDDINKNNFFHKMKWFGNKKQ